MPMSWLLTPVSPFDIKCRKLNLKCKTSEKGEFFIPFQGYTR